jgi:hypothetical protein
VLGIAPDAGVDEIRSAYRARAQALHPDRRASVDPSAHAEMAAVNQAWSVLRHPDRRAAYDRLLGGGADAGDRPAASTPRRSPSDPPPLHEGAPGCVTSFAGAAPWIALLAVLVAIFVFTAYADRRDGADTSAPTSDPALTRVRDLRGSCIGLANGATIVVDCFTVPHEGVIVAQASVGASCPDGTVEWLIRQQEVLACTEPGSEARAP